ncbi:MAG TPA: tetratricopeptide repeat protein [Paludibacter sp.]|nr:tetratricopeptide repeat protein [Paludibacter sp.]
MLCKLRFAFFIFCLFTVGCSLLPNQVKLAEQMMETNPDSALQILQHIHIDQSFTSANRALYGILLFEALDKNNKPLQPDSLITFSVRYYESTNDKEHLAVGYYYKARLYNRAQRFEDATLLYLKALDLAQNINNKILLGEIYSGLGDICSFQSDYDEALKKYQQSIICFKQGGDTIEATYKLIDLGRVYRFKENYSQAQIYYRKALLETSDSMLQGNAFQEMGVSYYIAKSYDSAQHFLRKSLQYPYKGNNYAIRCSTFADLFFTLNLYDSAFFYASKALKYPTSSYNERDCYRILANSEYSRGNITQMAYYMSKYQDCTDSVRKIEVQTKTSILEDIHHTTGTISKSKMFLFILGGLIFFVVAISLFIVYKLRLRNKNKEVQLGQAEEELTIKQSLLKDSLKQKIEENKALQSIKNKTLTIQQRELALKEIYSTCLHLNDWESFVKLINQTFNNVISILEESYPNLNQKELIWCCLFLLDVPSPDMCVVLECQTSTLYKQKQRTAQKMSLKGTKELEEFLLTLSEKQGAYSPVVAYK